MTVLPVFVEIMNLRNLERVLAREEEVKKRAIVHKAVYTGPQLRYLSKDGKCLLVGYWSMIYLRLQKNFHNHWLWLFPQSVLGPDHADLCFFVGYSYLEFSKGVSFQSELSTTSVPCKLTVSKVDMSEFLLIKLM